MTAPPWGHKPPRVDDVQRFWADRPPVLSERCRYWVRRYREGSWRPNKYVRMESYYTRAEVLGIYIWENIHVIAPLVREYEEGLR